MSTIVLLILAGTIKFIGRCIGNVLSLAVGLIQLEIIFDILGLGNTSK